MNQGAWAIVSLYIISNFCSQIQYPLLIVALDLINWCMFIAVWIALAVNIGSKSNYCSVSIEKGGHSGSVPCQTIYAALAFAILGWLLFTHSLTRTLQDILEKKANMANIKEGLRGQQNV